MVSGNVPVVKHAVLLGLQDGPTASPAGACSMLTLQS